MHFQPTVAAVPRLCTNITVTKVRGLGLFLHLLLLLLLLYAENALRAPGLEESGSRTPFRLLNEENLRRWCSYRPFFGFHSGCGGRCCGSRRKSRWRPNHSCPQARGHTHGGLVLVHGRNVKGIRREVLTRGRRCRPVSNFEGGDDEADTVYDLQRLALHRAFARQLLGCCRRGGPGVSNSFEEPTHQLEEGLQSRAPSCER